MQPPQSIEEIKAGLETTEKGGVRQSIRNCLTVFQRDPLLSGAIAYNILTDRKDIIKPIGFHRESTALNDTDMKYLLLYLEETYGLTNEKKIDNAIGIVANENKYHPIRDYLSSLVWDGTERIRFCLRHFLGADADDYTYEALKLFLLGAISRAFQPGCKFEIMLCLVGGQGAGKSTFFRLLAVRDEWFSDDLRKLDDDNERLGFEVTYIKPTTEGYIRPEDVEAAIRPDTALISIMMANNEIGTIQPIKEIAEIAHKHGVWMHTDAVQAVGAIPVDVKELGVDMLSMSAHKFNGPKGMGALYCRKGIWPQNLIDGGSQEARHRAGTENVAGIAGMGKALEMATEHLEERMAHEKELRDYVIDRILKNIPEARLNGGLEHRLPGNANISFPGLEGETILLDLDMHGICASTGSACNSDSLDPSHVLLSIGVPEEIGHGSMRFTFGPQNTMEEAKYLCDVLEEVIPRRRAMSCMWLQGQNTARHFSLKGEN